MDNRIKILNSVNTGGGGIRSVAIIGHFGGKEKLVDGQTVKTLNLYEELKSTTSWKIKKVDTYYKKEKPILLLLKFLWSIITTRRVIILLSGNGMRFFFPILSVYSRLHLGLVFHDVIGGNLSEYVKTNPKYKRYLNSFKSNWVETDLLKQEMEDVGVMNCFVIPNFRRQIPVAEKELKGVYSKPYKMCTFSRVSYAKGIEDAINAIQNINNKTETTLCMLDIYGPIDVDYQERFDAIKQEFPEYIRYKGVVPTDSAVETLREYFCTLFPTRWDGESNAGTVTESQAAGIPVIATDWRCNSEMIQSGVNGIIYPGSEASNLEEAITWMIAHSNKILDMKKASLHSAARYTPEYWIPKIVEQIIA